MTPTAPGLYVVEYQACEACKGAGCHDCQGGYVAVRHVALGEALGLTTEFGALGVRVSNALAALELFRREDEARFRALEKVEKKACGSQDALDLE